MQGASIGMCSKLPLYAAAAGRDAPIVPEASDRPAIPALTGLRFLAAFLILLAHTADWLAQFNDSHISAHVSFLATYGMTLFFVLSGFVIHYNYREIFIKESIGRAICEFAAARFARLYPLFFVFLLVGVAADNFLPKIYQYPHLVPPISMYYLSLTQSWWYIVYQNTLLLNWLFPLSWSISTEMFFYVVYAAIVFVILAVCRRGHAISVAIAYTFLTAGGLWLVRYELVFLLAQAEIYVPDYISLQVDFGNSFFRWLFYFSPYVRVLEFILGCFTAEAFLGLRSKQPSSSETYRANVLLLLAIIYLVLSGLLVQTVFDLPLINAYAQFYALNFLCAPPIAVVLFYVARHDTHFNRLFSSPAMVALGEISYSIYLVHSWTLRIFLRPVPDLTWFWAFDTIWRMVCAIGFTLMVSFASYRLIERPSRLWIRGHLRRLIASVFGRDSAHRHFAGVRFIYSTLALTLLPLIAVAGQAARSDRIAARLHHLWFGNRPEIRVIEATYGANCLGLQSPYPIKVFQGNATKTLQRWCDRGSDCDFEATFENLGDPANSCGKDLSVEYSCSSHAETKFVVVAAEGKHALLRCDARAFGSSAQRTP